LHCEVAFVATAEGMQTTETEEMEDDIGGGWLPLAPLPQAVPVIRITHTMRASRS
jgi:hypothetical protein